MARTGVREHSIAHDTFHYKWDNSLPPAVEIDPGDIVNFDTEEVTSGQLKKGDPASTSTSFIRSAGRSSSKAPSPAMLSRSRS